MLVNTQNLEREAVLYALTMEAIKKLCAKALVGEGLSDEAAEKEFRKYNKLFGDTVTINGAVKKSVLNSTDFIFTDITINKITIPLHISLKNDKEFDSTAFDAMYDSTAAEKVINKIRPAVDSESMSVEGRKSGSGSTPLSFFSRRLSSRNLSSGGETPPSLDSQSPSETTSPNVSRSPSPYWLQRKMSGFFLKSSGSTSPTNFANNNTDAIPNIISPKPRKGS